MIHPSDGYGRQRRNTGLSLLALATGAVAAYGVYRLASPSGSRHPVGDAPRKAWRWGGSLGRQKALVGRTVTINRPRKELYAFWRDFSNLPQFMENIRSVSVLDDKRSRWTVAAPAGASVEFTTRITEERPNELIASQSDDDVQNSGRIEFRDAPGGRGTEVEATIAYDPPAGAAGRLVAKLFQREPRVQARRDLKRFKQLMETGEITVSDLAPQHDQS